MTRSVSRYNGSPDAPRSAKPASSKPAGTSLGQVKPPRRRYQFRLRTLFLITVLVAILSGVLSGILRRSGGTSTSAALYVAVGIMAPIGVMILFSLWSAAKRRK